MSLESYAAFVLAATVYIFRLEKPRSEWEWETLRAHEVALLDALFGSTGTSVDLSELQNEFYRDLPDIREGMFELLLKKRYYERRPDRVKAVYIGAGIVLAALTLIGGNILAARLGESPLPVIIAGLLTGVIVAGFGLIMPARTVRRERHGWQALVKPLDRFHLLRRSPARSCLQSSWDLAP